MTVSEPAGPPPPATPSVADAGAGRRLTTVTIDQAISSASNILIAILAARTLGTATFGLFGVVFLAYVTTQGVTRALVAEPLLVRPQESHDRPGEAIGTGLLLGAAVGAVVAVGGALSLTWDHDLGLALLVLAACTPLLVLQDLGRFLGFALHRPGRALALDITWLGLLLVAVACLSVADHVTLTWFISAWAGSGALAGTVLLWQNRGHRIRATMAWLRETWPFSWRYAVSFASRQGSVLLASSMLAGVLGARALGALRGTVLLYGPLVQFQAASVAAGVTEVARTRAWGPELQRHVRRSTCLTTGMAILNLVILLFVPDSMGELVLGDTWAATQSLLWPAGIQMALWGLISGVRAALLGMGATSDALRVEVLTAVAMFLATVGGALLWDVVGVFWSTAAAQGLVTVVWWFVYRSVRSRQATPGPAPAVAPTVSW